MDFEDYQEKEGNGRREIFEDESFRVESTDSNDVSLLLPSTSSLLTPTNPLAVAPPRPARPACRTF